MLRGSRATVGKLSSCVAYIPLLSGYEGANRTRSGVLQLKVLVGKLGAIDRLAPGAVARGEVAALAHELSDNAVERGALVAEALLTGAERTEVLCSLGNDLRAEMANRLSTSVLLLLVLHACGSLVCGQMTQGVSNRGFRWSHVRAERHLDAASRRAADCHVEVDHRVGHCWCLGWWGGEAR